MFYIQDDILDFMKMNRNLGCTKDGNIDDAMVCYYYPYINIYGMTKLNKIKSIIQACADKLYTSRG